MLVTLTILAAVQGSLWTDGPALPRPVANNAVTAVITKNGTSVYSLLGLDSTKQWSGVVNWVFRWTLGDDAWEELDPVPGPGRLAATAEAFRGRVYLFGGYTVGEDGSEESVANVDIFDPRTGSWSSAAPFPLPVDDAISGVWMDSLIFIVSGWHDTDNVPDVQVYDPSHDHWTNATPIPGSPVFGHAGAVAGNTIVYLGGVNTRGTRPRYRIEPSAWRGDIDPDDPRSITWTRLPPHPDPPRYRAAAVSVGRYVVFAGGTDNPYNYNGRGYDGRPSQPESGVFAYDVESSVWIQLPDLTVPTMDHRAMAVAAQMLILTGGMESGQRVTARTQVAKAGTLLEPR